MSNEEPLGDTQVVESGTEERREIHQGDVFKLEHRLELLEEISRGGMGSVWRAYLISDKGVKEEVAVKIAHPGSSFSEAIVREAEILTKLDFRTIAKVYSLQTIGGRDALIMQYVHGKDFRRIVEDHNCLELHFPEKFTAFVGWLTCEALKCGHNRSIAYNTGAMQREVRRGVIHGDMSPQNVIGVGSGGIIIVDYGTSIIAGEQSKKAVGGKLHFVAPEILEGCTPNFESDIYGLGATLFYISLGEYPLNLPQDALVNKTHALEYVRELHSSGNFEKTLERRLIEGEVISSELGKIIYSAMRKNPKERFPEASPRNKAEAMRNELTSFLYIDKGYGPTQDALGIYLEIISRLREEREIDDNLMEGARKQMPYLFKGDNLSLKEKKKL